MSITRRLLSVLGARVFVAFGLVTFLMAALLATVNITSRYALKLYIEDQLQRIPWDVAVYQRSGVDANAAPTFLQNVDGVTRVESLAFLRARFPDGGDVMADVDRKPLQTPWLCLLAASDPSILPPELGFALQRAAASPGRAGPGDARSGGGGAVMALVGPERAMGKAFLALQGAREFRVQVLVQNQPRFLFSTPLHGVIRLERDELNRWLMDQTGSVSYIPYIGVILLMPYRADVLHKFDQVATGLVPPELLSEHDLEEGHIQLAEYEPEMVYLARVNRAALISGWDVPGSLRRVSTLHARVQQAALGVGSLFPDEPKRQGEGLWSGKRLPTPLQDIFVDSTTEVLLSRMDRIARLIGVVSMLVALPLLWMAWVLAANLAGLLMLNERRTLGLMRLRGISGELLGRALLISIVAGGLAGGTLGIIAGSVVPLMAYEGGRLPADVLLQRQQVALLLGFLLVSLALAIVVSRRLVRYATTISPLEASGRVASSEAISASRRFGVGIFQAVSLALGSYVLLGWIFDFRLADVGVGFPEAIDRLLDFLGLPLFLYGVSTLLASSPERIQHVLAPLITPIGGRLGRFALHHVAVKPHRTVAFLLIVALMASVSLYPTITSRSFADKAVRGARVQLGAEWQLLFNAPDLVDVSQLRGSVAQQLAALRPEIEELMAGLRSVRGVRSVTYMVEAVLPTFYLPGYGLRGVPLYLVGDTARYRADVYSEPEVGLSAPFDEVVARLSDSTVGVSPPVADFWRIEPDTSVLLGLDAERRGLAVPASGVLAFLPGIPPRSVTDRQGYVQARVDYLNYLFSSNAYLVAAADSEKIGPLQVLVPRVIVLVNGPAKAGPHDFVDGPAEAGHHDFQQALVRSLPFPPLEIHHLDREIGKVGSDMYISLALANMRIYLLGGLALALVAILAIVMANYAEDRRTFALLRIRGASPMAMWRFVLAMLLAPALVGLVLGGLAALLAGYGLANYVWTLREIRTVVQLLPTRLVVSSLTAWILLLLVLLLVGVAAALSAWIFRRTAHERVREA